MCRASFPMMGGGNVCAFLDMIAWSEGTAQIPGGDQGYAVLVGATVNTPLTFPSYATHPNVLNIECDSTAAGRYQLLHRYYVDYAALLRLPDFSPISQDRIAAQQIKESGAFAAILAGDFQTAVQKCNHIWASLTGSPYGQHTNSITDLLHAYATAGGQIA